MTDRDRLARERAIEEARTTARRTKMITTLPKSSNRAAKSLKSSAIRVTSSAKSMTTLIESDQKFSEIDDHTHRNR
jgi:hypothetical protein